MCRCRIGDKPDTHPVVAAALWHNGIACADAAGLLALLLAIAELAIATPCAFAFRSSECAVHAQTFGVLVIFHVASGCLGSSSRAPGRALRSDGMFLCA